MLLALLAAALLNAQLVLADWALVGQAIFPKLVDLAPNKPDLL